MSKPVTVTGVESIIRAATKATGVTTKTIAAGLEQCGNIILRKSWKYVPVDTGELKSTGRVMVEGVGMNAKVRVTYGSDKAFYAMYVHENLTAHHEFPTCAKFLERAIRETRGTCTALMKRSLKAKTEAFYTDVDLAEG